MKLPFKYKQITTIEDNIISDIESSITEEDWYTYDFRQRMFPAGDNYNSILIRHSSEYSSDSIRNMPLYDKFFPLISPILDTLKSYYNYSDYVAFFARLRPNTSLNDHVDSGEFLERIHRIHVPIKTCSKCLYFVEDEWMHWERGKVYEFDNQRLHNARNDGVDDRIHLIINLYPST